MVSFNNYRRVRALNLVFCSINILQTFINLMSLTRSSLQILEKTQMEVFSISGFIVKSLINKDCPNSRTSDVIDITLGPLTKLDKRNTKRSKKLTMISCQEILTALLFIQLIGQFGAIQKLNSKCIALYSSIFINNLLSNKN